VFEKAVAGGAAASDFVRRLAGCGEYPKTCESTILERTVASETNTVVQAPGRSAGAQIPAHEGAAKNFWRILSRFDSSKLQPYLALRNTAGVVLPLIAGYALNMPRGGLSVAIGALNVSYSDGSDRYASRARRMLLSSVLCAIAVFVGAVSGRHYLVAAASASAWAFVAGLVFSISATAGDLGVISTVSLLVYAAQPLTPRQAALSGLLALVGGLFQTGLSIAMWPVRRYEPERRALASFYQELAQSTEVPAQTATALPATQCSALSGLERDATLEGVRYRALLSQAERMQLGLLTLSRLRVRVERENPSHPSAAFLARYFQTIGGVLRLISDSLVTGNPVETAEAPLAALEACTKELREAGASAGASFLSAVLGEARYQMAALNGQLRAAMELANHATPVGEAAFRKQEAEQPWWLRFRGSLATLRANLNLQSSACRHAIRLAICVAMGDLVGRSLDWHRSYWLPMTVVIVLKPDFTSTFSRGVLRIAGTIAGLFLATALLYFLPHATSVLIVQILVFTFLLRWVGPANYGISAIAVSGLIVGLITILGVEPSDVIWARGVNSAAGGCLALLAYWIWPTWERTGVPERIAQLLDAYREYFHALTQDYVNSASAAGVQARLQESRGLDEKRLATRRARSNLEASMDRVSAEPGTTAQQMNQLNAMLASSHRFVNAVMALEAGWRHMPPSRARAEFGVFAEDVEKTLFLLAKMLQGTRVRTKDFADLREDQQRLVQSAVAPTQQYALVDVEADRITNSLNTLREQVTEWVRVERDG
jgi:uncharacterized membrane protein YccC